MAPELRQDAPPDVVMRALAGELASLQAVAADLEDSMATVVCGLDTHEAVSANRQILQDFDLLTQSLEGLKSFVISLAAAAEGRPSIRVSEALAVVKLGDMRDRLAGRAIEDGPACQTPRRHIEIDLF